MNVAVLGAGYAGLALARTLEDRLPADVEIVVVDERETHLVQHQIHRVVRHPSLADDLAVPLSDVLDRATVRRARVTDVDPEAGVATLDSGRLDYDVGAVCLGAETEFHDLPGVAEHATPLKRIDDAERIRADFLDLLETGGRAVVGGAGLSGVQVAGELAELAREEDADDVEVVLLERLGSVAPNFPAPFGSAVRDELEKRGVEVRTGARVAGATADRIELDGKPDLSYDAFVWTGGIRGSDSMAGERPVVRSTLRLGGDTFAVGDAARVVDADGEPVPASAQSAVREARTVARNVERLVAHRRGAEPGGFEPRLDRFRFDSAGWLVSVGDGAVAQVGPSVVTGAAAKAMKAAVGAGYLTSVGAVRNAVEVVRETVGGLDPEDVEDAVPGKSLDDVVPDERLPGAGTGHPGGDDGE